MLLADATPTTAPANTIGMAVIAGSLLLSAFSGILAMFFTRREHIAHKEEVNRRLTAMENQFAAVASQFGTVHEEIKGTRKEITESERRLAEAGEDRAVKIHDRLNDVLTRISEVRGELNANRSH